MKILMVQNKYKFSGGEDISTEAEINLLLRNNVEVHRYVVNNDSVDDTMKIRLAINTIWSNRHYRDFVARIKYHKYDLIHVQNFFPLISPSIFYAAHRCQTKIIMSVRNYRMICPNALMYVNGSLCSDCVGKTIPISGFMKKCYKDSYTASAVAVAMVGIHNLLNTWNSKVNAFICISNHVKQQLMISGFDKRKLYVKPNFVHTTIPPNFHTGDYYIYVGRLSVEKGLDVLVQNFCGTDRKLMIIGDGPLESWVRSRCAEHRNIFWVGRLPLEEGYEAISLAKALIFPSKCNETFGRTIAEAFAHGTPVIGCSIGGAAELIEEGINGFYFDVSKRDDLRLVVDKFETIDEKSHSTLRKLAYETYLNKYMPDSNFRQLMEIYEAVLSN